MTTASPYNTVTLDRGRFTTCTVNLQGGCVTSWRVLNKEQLYFDYSDTISYMRHVEGGINFSFPYVGKSMLGPENGLGRKVQWYLKNGPTVLKNKDVVAVFVARDTPYTRSMLDYNWEIENVVYLGPKSLGIDVTMTNLTPHFTYSFNQLQKIHLYIPRMSDCKIVGAEKSDMDISSTILRKMYKQSEHNWLYINMPDMFFVTNTEGGGKIKVTKQNQPDVHVSTGLDAYDPEIDTTNCDLTVYLGDLRHRSVVKSGNSINCKLRFEKIFPDEEDDGWMYEDIFKNIC